MPFSSWSGIFFSRKSLLLLRSIRRIFFLTNSIIIRLAACHIPLAYHAMSFCQGNRAWSTRPTRRSGQAEFAENHPNLHRTRFDQSPRRVHSRDIPRNRNIEILRDDVTLSRRKPSLHRIRNSNDTRAPFFFFFLSRLRPRRRCSCTRIVIRRPGRNDSANGTTLAVVSTR